MIACQTDSKQKVSTKKAATFLLGQQPEDSLKWKLIQTYDPYNHGQIIKRDSLNPRFLVFEKDGSFKQYDKHNASSGSWYLNNAKTALAFIFNIRNGQAVNDHSTEKLNFRHQIRKYGTDTMILAWQGRHGFVEELYVRYQGSLETRNE